MTAHFVTSSLREKTGSCRTPADHEHFNPRLQRALSPALDDRLALFAEGRARLDPDRRWFAPGDWQVYRKPRSNAGNAGFQVLPETAKRMVDEGAEVEIRTPADIREMIKADLVKWAKVAQDANMPKR